MVSAIICTHNPRPDYLRRVFDALKAQTLPKEQWELLLVDNASKEQLAEIWDLSWHPQARHVREDQLGLTAARIRGFSEAKTDLFVCIDDDNLLSPDYLEQAQRIGASMPWVGAWGGQQVPEFEVLPSRQLNRWLWMLSLNSFEEDCWSNYRTGNLSIPCGAGMCVLAKVAKTFASRLSDDSIRRKLGRTGNNLMSCEDIDLALTACDMGMAAGRFRCLKLVHLIPKSRLQIEYLCRLAEGMLYSSVVLERLRGASPKPINWTERIRRIYGLLRSPAATRPIQKAAWRGADAGAFVPLTEKCPNS